MPLYEHVFLARQDISAQQVEGLMETFKSIISDNGGSVGKTEYWGLRSLAYRIKKKRKAHYALMNIEAPHEAVAEMERQMRIENDVIRFLTLRVDEHETDPSAMMKRQDRDDRRGPRGGRDGPPRRGHDGPPRGAGKPDDAPKAQASGDKAQASDDKAEAAPAEKTDDKPEGADA